MEFQRANIAQIKIGKLSTLGLRDIHGNDYIAGTQANSLVGFITNNSSSPSKLTQDTLGGCWEPFRFKTDFNPNPVAALTIEEFKKVLVAEALKGNDKAIHLLLEITGIDFCPLPKVKKTQTTKMIKVEVDSKLPPKIKKTSVSNERGVGYIYVIVAEASDKCKIGYSKDPIYRMAQLQIANFDTLVLKFHKKVTNMASAERRLHKLFNYAQVKGEWFQYSLIKADLLRLM